jgi:hypothetical protein
LTPIGKEPIHVSQSTSNRDQSKTLRAVSSNLASQIAHFQAAADQPDVIPIVFGYFFYGAENPSSK